MSDVDAMNKVERLALAAAVAPVLRSATEQTKRRRIGTLDKDGHPTGRYVDGSAALRKGHVTRRRDGSTPTDT